MSFSYKFKTLGNGNLYKANAQLEMSAHEEEVTGKVEADATEGNDDNSVRLSPDLVDEGIKASLEPLHAQISFFAEMMDRLMPSNSARETTTASSRETRHQYESPYNGVVGSCRFPTVAPLTTSGYIGHCFKLYKVIIEFRWRKVINNDDAQIGSRKRI